MKGVLLLGGNGTRLAPLTNICNKHMLPVGGKPMTQWNVEKLVNVGIKDILVISGTHHIGSIIEYFGSGDKFGCNLTYKVQDEAGGIAEALKLVEGFIPDEDPFIVILGDNIFEDDLSDFKFTFEKSDFINVALTSTKVKDPQRFGVFQDGGIVEKPNIPKSDEIVAGVYGYRYNNLFKEKLGELEYSSRGELEITDLNNSLIYYSGFGFIRHELKGYWTDAGTHESLKKASELVST